MKTIKQILNRSVLERREQRGSRREGKRESRLETRSLGPDWPKPIFFFFVNNVLLENSHTVIIYILSMAAIMVQRQN